MENKPSGEQTMPLMTRSVVGAQKPPLPRLLDFGGPRPLLGKQCKQTRPQRDGEPDPNTKDYELRKELESRVI